MKTKEEIDYKKIFNLFTLKDRNENKLKEPFVYKGFYAATDRCKLILMPTDKATINFVESEKPNVLAVIPSNLNCDVNLNIDDIITKANAKMVFEMYDSGTCAECNGDGYTVCSCCENEKDCDSCEGRGRIMKRTNNQVPESYQRFKLRSTVFEFEHLYAALITGKLLGEESIKWVHESEIKANLFTVGDMQIIIMPVDMYGSTENIKVIM